MALDSFVVCRKLYLLRVDCQNLLSTGLIKIDYRVNTNLK